MKQRSLAIVLAMVFAVGLVACAPQDDVAAPTPTSDDPDVAVCLEGEPFVDDGPVPVEGTADADAHEVSDLRWESHEGCERFVIDLATEDGEPATSTGDVEAEVLRDLGVVRITLRDVESVDLDHTDATFDGTLASAAYVMWAEEGRWIDVDVHLGDEAEAHVTVLQDPARVVVDLRPGGGPVPEAAAVEENTVVILEPRPGDHTYPLTVSGYARTFEANVVVRLEQDGEEVYDDFTTATAWADAWGVYSFTIEDGPTGTVAVHVGEHSARDGSWEGAVVEVNMR